LSQPTRTHRSWHPNLLIEPEQRIELRAGVKSIGLGNVRVLYTHGVQSTSTIVTNKHIFHLEPWALSVGAAEEQGYGCVWTPSNGPQCCVLWGQI
jgi:hypothetical protein